MNWFIVALIIGLVVCGLLVRRHGQRSAPLRTPATDVRPVDAWQRSIKLAPLGDDLTGVRLKLKLRAEEEHQKPEEGRN